MSTDVFLVLSCYTIEQENYVIVTWTHFTNDSPIQNADMFSNKKNPFNFVILAANDPFDPT